MKKKDKSQFYIGAFVKFKKDKNPNSIDVIFAIKDFNVYVEGESVQVMVDIQPIRDFHTPDGIIKQSYVSEANLLDLEIVGN